MRINCYENPRHHERQSAKIGADNWLMMFKGLQTGCLSGR